jgi:hypothetical protein
MRTIERVAFVSVGRGCALAALIIAILMAAMSFNLEAASRAGGIAGLIVCFILLMQAGRAPQNPHRRTELWLMLAPAERPPAAQAQALLGAALKNAYMRFAAKFACASAALLGASLLFALL